MTTLIDLKKAHRATWAAGDYAAVARHIDEAPPRDLLDRIEVRSGQDVLDVATGTGNVALRAAAAGGRVVGLDLTPELFAVARQRAEEQGVAVEWVEGDAEELRFADSSFDHVLPSSASSSRRGTRWRRPRWRASAGRAATSASSTGRPPA